MAWDAIWEKVFRERSWGRYPPEELVRFIARNFLKAPNRESIRILEIGCGPGSGTSWFLGREGYSVVGIDASPTAIAKSRERFARERLQGAFVLGSGEQLPFAGGCFDAVIDIGCLACNAEAETSTIVAEIHRVLKPAGVHFSITPQSGCWGDAAGDRLDATTLREVAEGPYARLGKIRFATRESLLDIYAAFRDIALEFSIRSMEGGTRKVSDWILTCRK